MAGTDRVSARAGSVRAGGSCGRADLGRWRGAVLGGRGPLFKLVELGRTGRSPRQFRPKNWPQKFVIPANDNSIRAKPGLSYPVLMPICTYLEDSAVDRWSDSLDADLAELLHEVNALPQGRWAIRSTQALWSKSVLYSLYSHLCGIEWQVINFPGRSGKGSTSVEKFQLETYLIGYLAGKGR